MMGAGDRKQGINKCWLYGGAPLAKKLESRIRTGDDLITCLMRYILGWYMILVMFE